MSSAAWVCDFCDTDNPATASVCRVCSQPPGAASDRTAEAPDQVTPMLPREEDPTFAVSRYAGSPITITLAPPPPVRPAPPAPPAPPVRDRPPAPPRPSRARPPAPPRPPRTRLRVRPRQVVGWCVAALVLILLIVNWHKVTAAVSSLGSASGSAGSAADGPVCPQAVAMWLPDGGSDSTLVVSYTSVKFDVTLCADSSGDLYYDGQRKGEPATDQYHISIPAVRTGSGFEAVNDSYRYEIDGTEELLLRNGRTISKWSLTRTGP